MFGLPFKVILQPYPTREYKVQLWAWKQRSEQYSKRLVICKYVSTPETLLVIKFMVRVQAQPFHNLQSTAQRNVHIDLRKKNLNKVVELYQVNSS